MNPNSDRCKELARIVVMTEREIEIWFKNNQARYRLNEPPNVQDDSQRNSKAASWLNYSHGVTEEHSQEHHKMPGNQGEEASCQSDRTGVPVSINAPASGSPE